MKPLAFFLTLLVLVTACGPEEKTATGDRQEVELSVLENPFVHSVYFWFKDDVSQEELATFYQDTEKLRDIKAVRAMYTGVPAATDRPIVERSYDFAVIVHFENLAGHDAYQSDAIHLSLLEKHSRLWEKIMITDVEQP